MPFMYLFSSWRICNYCPACKQVTCLGPNGIAAQLLALQDLLRWPHPKVTVSEIPDLDDGTSAYEDDLIRVWAVGKPAVPWNAPRATCSSDVELIALAQPLKKATHSDNGASDSTSSSSEDSGSKDSMADTTAAADPDSVQMDCIGMPETQATNKPGTKQFSDSESCSDDTSDSGSDGNQQQQAFNRIDHVLAGGGSPADVFAAMKPTACQRPAPLAVKRRLPIDPGALRAPMPQQSLHKTSTGDVELAHMPKRAKQNGRDKQEWSAIREHKSNVRVVRNAAGSIGKHADGAIAFVVFLKRSGRWLLLNFASEVRAPCQCVLAQVSSLWPSSTSKLSLHNASHTRVWLCIALKASAHYPLLFPFRTWHLMTLRSPQCGHSAFAAVHGLHCEHQSLILVKPDIACKACWNVCP